MSVAERVGVAAAVVLLAAGCYKSPRWSSSGQVEFTSRSTETVRWGSQLRAEWIESPSEIGVIVHEQPLCRTIAAGTARQPERARVFKSDNGTATMTLVVVGSLMLGAAATEDDHTVPLLIGGAAAAAAGLTLLFLPDSRTVRRKRKLGQVAAWTSDATPCGEAVPAQVEVAVDIANGAGTRAVRFSSQTDDTGKLSIARTSIDLWAGTCAEPVSGTLAIRAGTDRSRWEKDRVARTTAGNARFVIERGPGAGAATAERWAPQRRELTVTGSRDRALVRHQPGVVHDRFDGVVKGCVALRDQRIREAKEAKARAETEAREARLRAEREAEAARVREQQRAVDVLWQADEALRRDRFDAGDGVIYAWLATSGRLKDSGGQLVVYQDRGIIVDLASTPLPGVAPQVATELRDHLRARLEGHVGARAEGERVTANVVVGSYHHVAARRQTALDTCRRAKECTETDTGAHGFAVGNDKRLHALLVKATRTAPPSAARSRLGELCRCHGGYADRKGDPLCLTVASRTIDGERVDRPRSLDVVGNEISAICARRRSMDDDENLARLLAARQLGEEQWQEAARAKREARAARQLEKQRFEAEARAREARFRAEQRTRQQAADEARARACACGARRVDGQCPAGYGPEERERRRQVCRSKRNPDGVACTCPR
jgi:hypothetical protein